MKISKLFAITLQSKIRLTFLLVALTYNFVIGFYLKDFLVLSQLPKTKMVKLIINRTPKVFETKQENLLNTNPIVNYR